MSDVQSYIFCVAPNEVAASVAIHGYGMFDARDNGFSEDVGKGFVWHCEVDSKLLRSIFNRPKKRKNSENPKSLFYCLEIHFLSFSAGQIRN